jgi:GTPase
MRIWSINPVRTSVVPLVSTAELSGRSMNRLIQILAALRRHRLGGNDGDQP